MAAFAPGERHWHDATTDRGLSRIAIHEVQGSRSFGWMDTVTDADQKAEVR